MACPLGHSTNQCCHPERSALSGTDKMQKSLASLSHGKLDAGLSEESLNALGKAILGLLSVLIVIVATMSRGFSRTHSINPSTIRLDCAYYKVVLSAARQFTALHQLGPNNVPADAEQSGRLNLVAITEVIGCSGDCCLDLRV